MKLECGFNVCKYSQAQYYGLCLCGRDNKEILQLIQKGIIKVKHGESISSVIKCDYYCQKEQPKIGKYLTVHGLDCTTGAEVKIFMRGVALEIQGVKVYGEPVTKMNNTGANKHYASLFVGDREIGEQELSFCIGRDEWLKGSNGQPRMTLKMMAGGRYLYGAKILRVTYQDTMR